MNTTGLVMTVTDELLAEIEAKTEKFVGFGIRSDTVAKLVFELRRLRAENAELAKDAGRYRYLKRMGRKDIVVRDRVCHLFQSNLDSAVDTAMATK